jgi:microcystin-dependent protein
LRIIAQIRQINSSLVSLVSSGEPELERILIILNQIQQILSQISPSPVLPPITFPGVASFRQSYPIDFSLYDGEQHNVLYIGDNPTDQNLKIEILNTSKQNIVLEALDNAPDANSHHFELRFRPGTLSTASLEQIALADESNWRMSRPSTNSTGTVSLYFSSTTQPTITPGDKIDLTLNGVGVDASGGARGTRVELKYRNLKYQGSPDSLEGSRVEHLSIVGHRGRKNIPLHVGFVDSNTVLNDGSSQSELTLRITNTLKLAPSNPASSTIMFSKDTKAPSKFIISFDSGPDNEEWALGTDDQVQNIKVQVKFTEDSQWIEIGKQAVGSSPEWIIEIPQSLLQLDASQFIQIKLSEITTGHPSGHTNLYVHYENIPGYWDGQFVCTIEKAPLLYLERNGRNIVGIGIANNKELACEDLDAKLHIRVKEDDNSTKALRVAKGNSDYLTVLNNGNIGIGIADQLNAKLDIRVKPDDISTNALRVAKGNSDYLTVLNNGNVGIGNTNPSDKLEVVGNIKSNGRIKDKTGDVMPVGSILPYAGEQAPDGWLLCNGQSYDSSAQTYTDLYWVIGYKYGQDGNKFKVPDLQGRVPVGYGDEDFDRLGNTGGEKTHTLTINEMPSHSHGVNDPGHCHTVPTVAHAAQTGGIDEGGGYETPEVRTREACTNISIQPKGGGQPHNNLQPYLTVNFIIKY